MENFNIDKKKFFINVKIFWEWCKFPDSKNGLIKHKLPQAFSWIERKGIACMCQNILECIYANAIITSQEYIVSAMEKICIQATTRQPGISINW